MLCLISTLCAASDIQLIELLADDSEVKGAWLRHYQIATPASSSEQFAKSPWHDFRRAEIQLSAAQQQGQFFGDSIFRISDRHWYDDQSYRNWQFWAGYRLGSPAFTRSTKLGGAWRWHQQDNFGQLTSDHQINHYWRQPADDLQLNNRLNLQVYLPSNLTLVTELGLLSSWRYPDTWQRAGRLNIDGEMALAWHQWQLGLVRQEQVAYEDHFVRYYSKLTWQAKHIDAQAWYGKDYRVNTTVQWAPTQDLITFITVEWQNDEFKWTNEAITLAAGMRLLSR